MPTLIDALRTVWRHRYTYDVLTAEQVSGAYEQIRQTVDAYDALQPDWSDAPEWAQWYAIDAGGVGLFCEGEPVPYRWRWRLQAGLRADGAIGIVVDIPEGIDWRLCLFKRPETTAPASR